MTRDRSTVEREVSDTARRSEEHTSELQSQSNLVCRLLLEKKKKHRPNRPGHLVSHHREQAAERAAHEQFLLPLTCRRSFGAHAAWYRGNGHAGGRVAQLLR